MDNPHQRRQARKSAIGTFRSTSSPDENLPCDHDHGRFDQQDRCDPLPSGFGLGFDSILVRFRALIFDVGDEQGDVESLIANSLISSSNSPLISPLISPLMNPLINLARQVASLHCTYCRTNGSIDLCCVVTDPLAPEIFPGYRVSRDDERVRHAPIIARPSHGMLKNRSCDAIPIGSVDRSVNLVV